MVAAGAPWYHEQPGVYLYATLRRPKIKIPGYPLRDIFQPALTNCQSRLKNAATAIQFDVGLTYIKVFGWAIRIFRT